MTKRSALAALLLFALAACASVNVRTVTSPDAKFLALHTFNVLPNAKPRGPIDPSRDDPMLVNSISNQALRADLVKGFQGRGYVLSDHPDFDVAYYASAREKLDISSWDYGYGFNPYWWRRYGPGLGMDPMVTEYTQGTVIVDVIDPQSKELIWRGQGTAEVSDDERRYEQELQKTVSAILAKFPQAPENKQAAQP